MHCRAHQAEQDRQEEHDELLVGVPTIAQAGSICSVLPRGHEIHIWPNSSLQEGDSLILQPW